MFPDQWIAAANMAIRRGEPLIIRRVIIPAYNLELKDLTPLWYREDPTARAYRNRDQALAALARYELLGQRPRILDL